MNALAKPQKFRLATGVARAIGREREEKVKATPPGAGKDVPPPPSTIQLIDSVLAAMTDDPRYFRPSMVGGCPRQNVFHYVHAPTNPSKGIDPILQSILDTGTALHKMVQGYLGEHPGVFFAPEVPVWYPELNIRGHSDGLIVRRSDGYRWGFELKTTSNAKFQKLTKPDPNHVRQASIYAKLMGVAWITIVYWNRDRQHKREFNVRAVDSWADIKELVELYKAYGDAVDDPYNMTDDQLPDYDEPTCANSWDFCHYSTYCFKVRGVPARRPNGAGFFW